MTMRIFIALLVGASAVVAIVAAVVLWWLAHARTSTKGWVGTEHQVDKYKTQKILRMLKRRTIDRVRAWQDKNMDGHN